MSYQIAIDVNANDNASKVLEGVGGSLRSVGEIALGVFGGGLALDLFQTGVGKVKDVVVGTGKAVYDLGVEVDRGADAIIAGTGASGDALQDMIDDVVDLKASAAGFDRDMGVIGSVMAEINTRTGASGDQLETFTDQVLKMTRITGDDGVGAVGSITRAMNDWSVQLDDSGLFLDQVFSAGQTWGIGLDSLTGKLVQFGVPLRQMGFELDESIALLGKWEKEGVNTELVLGSMRIAAAKFAKEGVTLSEGWDKAIDSIKNATSETEALELGIELFGARAGPDMVGAIREGRFEIDGLTDSLNNAGGVIDDVTDRTLDFQERWQIAWQKIRTAVTPASDILFDFLNRQMPALEGFAVDIAGSISAVFERFEAGFDAGGIALGIANALQGIIPGLKVELDTQLATLDWGTFVTEVDLDGKVAKMEWGEFFTAKLDWGEKVFKLNWDEYVFEVDWDKKVVSLIWDTYVGKLNWDKKVTTVEWGTYVGKLDWDKKVFEVGWGEFLYKINWDTYVASVEWGTYLVETDWNTWITKIVWGTYVKEIPWGTWIPDLGWGDYIDKIDLGQIVREAIPQIALGTFGLTGAAKSASDIVSQSRQFFSEGPSFSIATPPSFSPGEVIDIPSRLNPVDISEIEALTGIISGIDASGVEAESIDVVGKVTTTITEGPEEKVDVVGQVTDTTVAEGAAAEAIKMTGEATSIDLSKVEEPEPFKVQGLINDIDWTEDSTHDYDVTGTVNEDPDWGNYTNDYDVTATVFKNPTWGNYTHTYNALARITNVLWGSFTHTYSAVANITQRVTRVVTEVNSSAPRYSSGTSFTPGGLSYVHQGELLVDAPRGGQVIRRDEVLSALKGGGGGGIALHIGNITVGAGGDATQAGRQIARGFLSEARSRGKI